MNDADLFVEADLEFHMALARATQNLLLIVLLNPIVDMLREQRKQIFKVEGGPQRDQQHHRKILEMVRVRDSAAARKAMVDHLKQVWEDSGFAIHPVNND